MTQTPAPWGSSPNGQWAWKPTHTIAAIARALADQLEKGPDT